MSEIHKAPHDTIFEQGPVNPYGKFFTGTSYLTMLSENDDVFHAPIGNVTFEPGTRTHWHASQARKAAKFASFSRAKASCSSKAKPRA